MLAENERKEMTEEIYLPEKIKKMTSGKDYVANEVGMSKAKVMVFDDCVLKIAPFQRQNEESVEVMRWLDGKLPVPKVLCFEADSEYQYLLMSKVTGKMSCDAYYMQRPEELIDGLAQAFRMLWSIDISDCPRERNLDVELAEARRRVENNLIDMDDVEPLTYGEGGFKDPEDLLCWLETNKPDYEPVLSHGDFCLPNIFLDNGKVSGFIDLGDTGIGDKWRDIALCYRSLRWNSEGAYGGKVYPDVRSQKLFDAIGIEPNMEKIRYYILLDELY